MKPDSVKLFKRKPMSNKHRKLLDRATATARTSTCMSKHAALIVSGSKVIASAVNVRRNDPVFMEAASAKAHSGLHAEVAALSRAKKSNLSGAIMYIARANRFGDPMNSKPCRRCVKAIQKAGIRKIFYTISNEMTLYQD